MRRGGEADAAAINALYDPYLRDTAITFDVEPWTLEARRRWLGEFSDAGGRLAAADHQSPANAWRAAPSREAASRRSPSPSVTSPSRAASA